MDTVEYIRKLSYESGRASALTEMFNLVRHMRDRGDMPDTCYDGLIESITTSMNKQMTAIDMIVKEGKIYD